MTLTTAIFTNKKINLFDQGIILKTENNFSPFAYTDLLTHQVSESCLPSIHFWEFEKTVILGMKDTRLKDIKAALQVLTAEKYNYLARNSGGLAVVSDEGILNFSLIIPNPTDQPVSINQAYEIMTEIIQLAFADFSVTITPKEISDSYCPGEYDLSIDGKKFAGTAQRRIRNGIAIMVYISVNGNQANRGQLIHNFYQAGLKEAFGTNGYPPVNPDSMANLKDLLQKDLTVSELKNRLLAVFTKQFSAKLATSDFNNFLTEQNLVADFDQQLAKMTRRNSDIMEVEVEG